MLVHPEFRVIKLTLTQCRMHREAGEPLDLARYDRAVQATTLWIEHRTHFALRRASQWDAGDRALFERINALCERFARYLDRLWQRGSAEVAIEPDHEAPELDIEDAFAFESGAARTLHDLLGVPAAV